MQIPFIPELKDIIVIFTIIGMLYGAYRILKPKAVNWIQSKLGISDLYKGQTEIQSDLKRGLEKMDSMLVQLTINGGSVTIKDDLTSIKKSLGAIKSELRASLDASPIPTFINEASGSCVYVNEALCNLFGATREEMLGYGWINFLPDEEKKIKAENWQRGIKTDTSIRDRYHVIKGDTNEVMLCEYTATITRDSKGEPISILGTVKKIS